MSTRTINPYPHIPLPAGATDVSDWEDAGTPDAYRHFDLVSWVISDKLAVHYWGKQYPNGRVDHEVVMEAPDTLTPDEARQLGPALIEAANQVDRWAAE
jgi:hypothetical protein